LSDRSDTAVRRFWAWLTRPVLDDDEVDEKLEKLPDPEVWFGDE